jgi:hypothetical protein
MGNSLCNQMVGLWLIALQYGTNGCTVYSMSLGCSYIKLLLIASRSTDHSARKGKYAGEACVGVEQQQQQQLYQDLLSERKRLSDDVPRSSVRNRLTTRKTFTSNVERGVHPVRQGAQCKSSSCAFCESISADANANVSNCCRIYG